MMSARRTCTWSSRSTAPGLVGNDGRTHQGVFDLSYLRIIPHMVVMAPKDEDELRHMLYTAVQHDGPIALRYPRGAGYGVPLDEPLQAHADRQGRGAAAWRTTRRSWPSARR